MERLLAAWRAEPSRTGSLIISAYGDAIVPRGGEVGLADLIDLLGGLGIGGGVVRTAVSRLLRDGWLERCRVGRNSFYGLAEPGRAVFAEAARRIYGPLDTPWGGRFRLVLPDAGADRAGLETAGYVLLAPGALVAPDSAPPPGPGALHLLVSGEDGTMRALAARAWPLDRVADRYTAFLDLFAPLGTPAFAPADALRARVLLIHEYRRAALRDPHLPAALLPQDWPGTAARLLCATLYAALLPLSERALDGMANRSGPLPKPGPDLFSRFSDGDTRFAAPASSPAR